jgi:uncharacterized protein YbjT (DUF2867 family)
MAKILIVGGTGAVGREVVRLAGARGLEPRVLARDPARARTALGPSVEIVKADLDDPASLAAALRGIEMASLATAPGPSLAPQETAFIEAGRAAGLKRIVNLSAFHVPHSPISAWHAASELRLQSSGVPHVILRPVMFMSNFLLFDVPSIKAGRIASVFGAGRMSWVDPVDVAELTVHALTQPEAKVGDSVWTFGGPEALSYDEVAATFSRVLGRAVEHLHVDEEMFRKNAPLPPFVVEAILATAAHVAAGKMTVSDSVVREKLGRPAGSFRAWVEAHRAAFA